MYNFFNIAFKCSKNASVLKNLNRKVVSGRKLNIFDISEDQI